MFQVCFGGANNFSGCLDVSARDCNKPFYGYIFSNQETRRPRGHEQGKATQVCFVREAWAITRGRKAATQLPGSPSQSHASPRPLLGGVEQGHERTRIFGEGHESTNKDVQFGLRIGQAALVHFLDKDQERKAIWLLEHNKLGNQKNRPDINPFWKDVLPQISQFAWLPMESKDVFFVELLS